MKAYILSILLIMATLFNANGAAPKFSTPDFAYPQKVIKSAQKNLDAGLDPLRCMLEIATAERAIDPDTIFTLPASIEKQITKAKTDADRAMLTAFEAEVYSTIYRESKWKYNRVDAPLMPLPEDISKWSAQQFAHKLNELYDSALKFAKADNKPLADYKDAIEFGKESLDFIPDIYGFIQARKFDNFEEFYDAKWNNTAVLAALCDEMEASYDKGSCPAIYWACNKVSLENYRERYGSYMAIYKANSGKPGAPYALVEAMYSTNTIVEYEDEDDADEDDLAKKIAKRDEMIKILRTALTTYPDFYRKAVFENSLKELTQPKLTFSVQSMAAPGSEVKVNVHYAFAKSVAIGLYKLPMGENNYTCEKIAKLMPCLAKKTVGVTGTDGQGTVAFALTEPGKYAIVPILDGKVQKNASSSTILCTPFIPVNVNECSSNAVVTVDYTTGAPFADVAVDYMKAGRSNSFTKTYLGKTGKSGMLAYTAPKRDGYWGSYVQFTYKGQVYNFNRNIRAYVFTPRKENEERFSVNIFTDRNIYHPGDTIAWAVGVVGKQPGEKPAIYADRKLRVVLYNTNNTEVGEVAVSTDALGRASGTFATEKGTLTGSYRIQVKAADNNKNLGSSYVMVSDFKLPTFEAEFTSVERDVPAAGDIRLTGKARTYSGMPVADATVSVKVRGAERWRWFIPNGEIIGTYDAKTDVAGMFTVVIPAADLKKENYSGDTYDNFQASAVVTSTTAEIAECNKNFSTGKPYVLSAEIANSNVDTSLPLAVTFKAYNADGENKPIGIKWQLLDDDEKTVLSGEAKGGERLDIDVSSLAANDYVLRLAPADKALADTVAEAAELALYNVKRNRVPAGRSLFLPKTEYTVTGHKVEVIVGTDCDAAYVYPMMQLGEDLVTFEPRKISRGFDKLKFELPETHKEAKVIVFTVKNGLVLYETVVLSRPKEKAVEIVAESFRDRLVPGAPETWRFRLVDGKGKGLADAAFVATMYNKALDRLQNGSFGSAFNFYTPKATLTLDYRNRESLSGSTSISFINNKVPSYEWPVYLYWDERSYFNSLHIRGTRPLMKMATNATADLAGKAEGVAYDTEEEVVLKESVVASCGVAVSEDNGAAATTAAQFEYRLSEVFQALWRPGLVTDANGNVDIVFTVPNANTTWQFKAAAWTKDLAWATHAAEALANKPVMVQPNLPRFLRQGDKATVLATVFNNTTDTASVVTTVEIFDINTNKVVESREFTDIVAPDASAIVAMPLTAAVDATAVGYRVRSVSGSFADGEQAVIPVLSAASTVIESTEFYLNPKEEKPFALTVKASADASVTLQYCQNPVWTVVKAMRGIAGRNETTSTGLVGRLFSAWAAKYIIEQNPSIAKAIKQWSDNPSEEALVSMLEKNEDLKRLMLDQTPWVQAAATNSQRMAALADLLDPAKADAAINAATTALAKLQNPDGGFQWGGWSKESSEWATRGVLTTIGIAKSLNLIPASSNIEPMLQSAFSYVEKEATKPQRSKTDNEFALIATFLPSLKHSVAGDRLIRNTVSETARNWRTDGTLGKAYDVLLLAGNGRAAEARKVYESIREFGVVKGGMGLCFPSVDDIRAYATLIQAYATMKAADTEIDAMRQWVIVQAQANDDLGAYNPDYVIAAVLMTGSNWTDVAVKQNVTVNGQPLEINSIESATGYFAQRIDRTGKIKIVVTPNGVTPSYGSVVTIDRRPMESVKARPGKDLAIEKRVLVERDGQWVETNDFALGERVRVQLTIVAKRNLEYVSIDDERPACFKPVDQLPGYVRNGGLSFYRENLDASTRLFISYMPQGTYHVTYDMTAALAGSFISGIATLQSQYAPELTAHSGAARIAVK